MTLDPAKLPFVMAWLADQMGCGYHRIQIPLGTLVAAGLVDGRIDFRPWQKEWFLAARPQVCVFQRPVDEWQIENIRTAREALPDAFLVLELDDNIWDVPPANYHAGFIPEAVKAQLVEALSLVDAVSTTTLPLAADLQALGAKDVRIIPNLLPADKFQEREPKVGAKLRIGFGGGVSHAGDLALIEPAIREIGDGVEWVFLGMKPEGIPLDMVEFHEGVPPAEYTDKMRSLDLDLVLAPLEMNRFNQCKSNLRLVEAGACCSAAIAQDIDPYHENEPPVFAHCRAPNDWTVQIRSFMMLPPSKRMRHAHSLQAWAKRNYSLQARLHDRLRAWMPDAPAYWEPRIFSSRPESVIVACSDPASVRDSLPQALKRHGPVIPSLELACNMALAAGSHVLWLRPGVALPPDAWERIRSVFAGQRDIASVAPLAGDGPNAWPHIDRYSPMSAESVATVSRLAGQVMSGKRLELSVPAGPCVLLNGHALGLFGAPDSAGMDGNDEAAIMEWGARSKARGWRHVQACDAYVGTPVPPAQGSENALVRLQLRGTTQAMQMFGVQALDDDLRADLEYAMIAEQSGWLKPGVAGLDGSYATWKALRSRSDTPNTQAGTSIAFRQYGRETPQSPSEWVVYYAEDVPPTVDKAAFTALEQACAEAGPDVFAVYCDHEVEIEGGKLVPDFKPDFDLELFLGRDYVTPFVAIRSNLLVRPPADPVDLYRIVLATMLTACQTLGYKPQDVIKHVPHVLGRVKEPPAAERLKEAALRAEVARNLIVGLHAVPIEKLPGMVKTIRKIAEGCRPLVSIIVPSPGRGWLLQPCLNTILSLTDYSHFEIILVMTAEGEPDVGRKAGEDPRLRIVRWTEPFNFSAINNWAVREHARGEYILLMNDDVRVGGKEWLSAMLGRAMQPDAGAVGARLVYPQGLTQHVGVISHNGSNGHIHKMMPAQIPGLWGLAVLPHENAAVTGACLLVSRENWDKAGGLREDLPYNYNDVAFCVELRRLGLRNMVETAVDMQHAESSTRPAADSPFGMARLREENAIFGPAYPDPDPYWNPNYVFGSNGVQVVGLNFEILRWDEEKPVAGAERVLVINGALVNGPAGPSGKAIDVRRAGGNPMVAEIASFTLTPIVPSLANSGNWDIRSPAKIARALSMMGVDRIILCSLTTAKGESAAPVETLRCLASLGVPVSYEPRDSSEAEKPGETFGAFDTDVWQALWRKFFVQIGHAGAGDCVRAAE